MKIVRKALYILFVLGALFGCSQDNFFVDYNRTSTPDSMPDNGLPVIEITTDDGLGITDKKTWKAARIVVHGNDQFEDIEDSIMLKGRGNSTLKYPKKSFNIKFDNKQKMLGMKKAKKWVFLANYRDRTLMRNDITFWIGRQFDNLEWTPSGQFVDLMFNGHYVGNYYVCEKVQIQKNRLDIDEITHDNISGEALTGGYLLEIDKYFEEQNKFRTDILELPIGIKSPNEEECRPEHIEYIKNYLHEIETLLSEGQYEKLYDEYIDLPSFVDYYLVQVIAGNNDFNAPLSIYLYKKRSGKLYAGPLWDFDFSTYYKDVSGLFTTAWWYRYLCNDAHFRKSLKERWNAIFPILESQLFSYMEETKNRIFLSAMANFNIIEYDYTANHNNILDSGFLLAYDNIRINLRNRLIYLNELFNAQ